MEKKPLMSITKKESVAGIADVVSQDQLIVAGDEGMFDRREEETILEPGSSVNLVTS